MNQTAATSQSAATQSAKAASTLMVSGIMFGISTLVTLAFAYFLIADPSRLTEAWTLIRSLPLAVQVVMWLIFLPWMVALWVWGMPLSLAVRAAVVVVVLAAAEFLLFPWKRG